MAKSGLQVVLLVLILVILVIFAVVAVYFLYKIEKVIVKTSTDIEATLLKVNTTSDDVNNLVAQTTQQAADIQSDIEDAKSKLLILYLEIYNINKNVNELVKFSGDAKQGLCSNPQKFPFCT